MDTAGLREADCAIEKEGVARARAMINQADIVLFMLDASQGMDDSDVQALSELNPSRSVVVLNKIDLRAKSVDQTGISAHRMIPCSLILGQGLDSIREAILDKLGNMASTDAHAVISERHRQFVQNALNILNESETMLSGGEEDKTILAANCVRDAIQEIGKATGQIYTEELLDRIFSRFCVGK